MTKVITLLVLIVVLLGLWQQTGSGAWIYVKAQLAQVLLQRAWAGTLAGQRDVKPWPWADTWPVARLVVPSLGIDQIVLKAPTEELWHSGLSGTNQTVPQKMFGR